MAGLQRSVSTFRRSGSSGLVWEERFSSELSQPKKKGDENSDNNNREEFRELKKSRSLGTYRTGRVSPAIDPPSPKVSACGFCGIFGKPVNHHTTNTKRRPRRSK